MKCINCNVNLPDDATECSYCGAKVVRDVVRCPKCFVKIEKGLKSCPKCGYNFERKKENNENFEIKKPKKQIIIFSAVCVLIAALVVSAIGIWYSSKLSAFKKEANEFVDFVQLNMEDIAVFADNYNEIYNGDWFVYAENVGVLEKASDKVLDVLADNRDKITYLATELSQKSVTKKDRNLVKKVFEAYDEGYIYVIGKKGKYPGYKEGFDKIMAEYNAGVKELKKRIK